MKTNTNGFTFSNERVAPTFTAKGEVKGDYTPNKIKLTFDREYWDANPSFHALVTGYVPKETLIPALHASAKAATLADGNAFKAEYNKDITYVVRSARKITHDGKDLVFVNLWENRGTLQTKATITGEALTMLF